MIGVRRINKQELRRIAKSCGATIVTTMANDDGTENFDPECIGEAKVVYEDTVGDMDYLFIEEMSRTTCCTMLLRGPNDFALDEIDRSIHDALCVMKRTLESGYVVPGGGCVEMALNIAIGDLAKSLSSKSQEAVTEFSNALTIIP